MTVNNKIYDNYFDAEKELGQINEVELKIETIRNELKTLNNQTVFKDGEYEFWVEYKKNHQTNLENTIKKQKNMNNVIRQILNTIPEENKEFIFKPSSGREEFQFSKSGNSFTVVRTNKLQLGEGYRPDKKEYSIKE